MKKMEIMNNLTRTFNRTNLKLKKYAPEIMVVAGVAGMVVSAVMACKATTKVNDILEEAKEQIDSVHHVLETAPAEKYSEEDGKKALAIVYAQTGVKLIKLYGPSVVLGALSITSILTSNHVHRKRNVALAAAYTVVDTSFKDYRNRVIDRFGEKLDRELRYNIKAQNIEETVIDENGKEQKVEKTIEVVDPTLLYSDYARCYDNGCKGWNDDHESHLTFLKQTQRYMNDLLKIKGHVFLNEVYDALGMPRSKAGQIVGWIYDEKRPNGDNYIDFGIYDLYKEGCRDFVNGYEKAIWLDFNVDGAILNLI